MSDNRTVDELTLQELEEIVVQRRRIARARRFAESADGRGFQPVTVMADQVPVKRPARPRTWRDRMLLVVEVIAALGLLAIIISSLVNLQTLNQEVVAARTVTPNPAAAATGGELPGSSFPPS